MLCGRRGLAASRVARARSGTCVDQHRLLSTLLDFPFWESLDRSGMARARIPDHIEQLALTALAGAPTGGLRN